MKAFIVFAAVVAVATANAVGRGWGSAPNIQLDLSAAAANAASGSAHGGQALLEQAVGNLDGPASILNLNGVGAGVSQGDDIIQLNNANIASGETDTINAVDAQNSAIATDIVVANIEGALAASIDNSANTDSQGEGALAAEASTINQVQSKKQ